MTAYFITGTDTDCGKTYVTCRLLDYWRQQQRRVVALKPLASGASWQNGCWVNDDVARLQAHNPDPSLPINARQFPEPISPHLAAERMGERVSVAELAEFCTRATFADYDTVLVEGAGGLMVPLNENETWLDFLQTTGMPVILVVGMRLGCLNHALLTAAVLQNQGIPCAGWIANSVDEHMLESEANLATLRARLDMPLLGLVRHGAAFEPALNGGAGCW